MNYVDVDVRSTRKQVFRRNLVHFIVVWGGTLATIALVYWIFFGVLLKPYW